MLCKKLNLTKVWAGIKSRLNPTLTFDKQTCNVFHHMFMLVLKICLARFKLEAIRLIKNVSSKTDVKSLFGWLRLGTFDCKHHKIISDHSSRKTKSLACLLQTHNFTHVDSLRKKYVFSVKSKHLFNIHS